MKINLTLDNQLRHPLRWRRCPLLMTNIRVFGLMFKTHFRVGEVRKQWVLIIYYGRRFKAFSNFSFDII